MMFFRLPFAVISVIYQPELKNNNNLLFNEVPGDISGKVWMWIESIWKQWFDDSCH